MDLEEGGVALEETVHREPRLEEDLPRKVCCLEDQMLQLAGVVPLRQMKMVCFLRIIFEVIRGRLCNNLKSYISVIELC